MRKAVGGLLVLGSIVAIFFAVFGSVAAVPSGPIVQSEMRATEQQVARDAVAQYNIAAQNGTVIDRCVQAGLVSAAYLQAQDVKNYKQWKAIERRDCRAAGLPQ